jgi:hypothetical protein
VQRFCFPRSAAPRGARLLVAACVALGCGSATAQMASPAFTDPLAPKLQTDPRNPPRFQKFSRPALAQLGPPTNFSPAASGAGDTGFDSTNSRKAKAKRNARTGTRANAEAIAPGLPQPASVSPYQKLAAGSGNGAYAGAPGTPPVELGPIRKPPRKRKAHTETDDPNAPIGIRAGAFLLFPAIELIGGYDTNPSQDPNGKGATLYTVAPELRLQSNWSRHELKADLRGSYTDYSPDTSPTLSRPYVNGKVDGRIDVTRTTRIDLGGLVLVSTDNPGSPNLQAGLSKLPIYTTFGGSAGLGRRFNRFDVSIKGDVVRTAYQDSKLTDGSTASNEDRNYNQYGGTLRGGYELSPGVTPFVEIGADTRVHDLNTDFFGYQRNSKGLTGSVGTSFELTRLLTGDVSIGYVRRTYDDPRLDSLSGLIGSASLVWTADALTTVRLTGASSVGESTVPGVPGGFYRDVGLQVDHAFRRWLIGSVKLGFGFDTYKNGATETSGGTTTTVCNCVNVVTSPGETITDRQDKRYSLGLGLTYKLDRSIQIKGEFRQDWLRSNVSGVDYTASVFLLGLRLQK